MKVIETSSTVGPDREVTLHIKLPPEVEPGEHRFLVVTDEGNLAKDKGKEHTPDLLAWEWEGWPADCTFRREDLYGNNGR